MPDYLGNNIDPVQSIVYCLFAQCRCNGIIPHFYQSMTHMPMHFIQKFYLEVFIHLHLHTLCLINVWSKLCTHQLSENEWWSMKPLYHKYAQLKSANNQESQTSNSNNKMLIKNINTNASENINLHTVMPSE